MKMVYGREVAWLVLYWCSRAIAEYQIDLREDKLCGWHGLVVPPKATNGVLVSTAQLDLKVEY